jgi:hypothetical protein
MTCLDCKVTVYCGYGSYGSWILADSVGEFFKQLVSEAEHWSTTRDTFNVPSAVVHLASFGKNMNVLRFLFQHEGHDVTYWSYDWNYHDSEGNLRSSHDDKLEIPMEKSFLQEDWDD